MDYIFNNRKQRQYILRKRDQVNHITKSSLTTFFIFLCPSFAGASNMSMDAMYISTIGGQAIFNGITLSSYTYFTTGSSLTLRGSGGYITTGSSVTASSFFGDGSQLIAVTPLAVSQTFSGANTFNSSFTIQSGGRQITISTSATINNVSISPSGVISFYPELHNSSFTIVPAASTGNQSCGPCVSGSTLTITTTGGRVEVVFMGGLTSANPQAGAIASFLQDGQFVRDLSSSAGIYVTGSPGMPKSNAAFRYLLDAPAPGQHSYCLTICAQSTSAAQLLNDNLNANLFFVKEIK